jgi:hypothetical protein
MSSSKVVMRATPRSVLRGCRRLEFNFSPLSRLTMPP